MEGGGGEKEIIYLSLHCHHQNDSCIKMGSNESHFNVSVGSDGQSHKTVSANHKLFEEKGEPKRYRTEVLPLTSLTLTARSNRLTACLLQTSCCLSTNEKLLVDIKKLKKIVVVVFRPAMAQSVMRVVGRMS